MGIFNFYVCLIIVVLVILFFSITILFKIYLQCSVKWCKSKVCLVGKTIIITGANAGIGFETALALSKRGARVILACRNKKRGIIALDRIKALTENKNVVLKPLDLASLKSVRSFAKDILENEERLDILINNAGLYATENKLSEDGLQLQWQINHFGPVLLTLLLLDLLKKSSPSRVINVSSYAASFADLTVNNFKQFNYCDKVSLVYCNTKLCNILFTNELAKKMKADNISVFSLHPGPVATELMDQIIPSVLMGLVEVVIPKMLLTPEEGAQTTLHLACQQNIESLSGGLFEYCKIVEPYKTTKDPKLSKKVWDETLKLLNYQKM